MRIIPKHIVIISTCVYLVLNFIENTIHFSIGRNVKNKDEAKLDISFPTGYDLIKIISIMTIFAILQGLLTYVGVKYF